MRTTTSHIMLVLLLVLHFGLTGLTLGHQCVSRDYGNDGTVCVCNLTYCDTIPRPQPVPPPQFLVYTSNQAGLRFQLTNGTISNSTGNCTNNFVINPSIKYQTIFGWGGAFTDATGININSLPTDLQTMLLRSYFSEDGIEYSMARVPIGGTDFSIRAYSYDDGLVDPFLINFQLAPEDYNYKIPYILEALSMTNGTLQLFASAWTAPRWMKTNDRYSGFGFIRKEFYQTWAEYFVRFLDAYQRENITFWGITTGNEPSDVLNPVDQLEVVGWTSSLIGSWIINNLGPTIRNSNYADIKIMILDDQRIFLPWYIKRALQDIRARNYIDGIAVHWYLDQYFSPELLTLTQVLYPEMFILGTEASIMPQENERAVMLGSWRRGEEYSVDIIQDMLNWVTGWVDWNMALNIQGGPNYISNFVDACIIVNATAAEFYKQAMYYHMGHFSKFVPTGSVRIHSVLSGAGNVHGVAFKRPDNGTAVVLLNRNRAILPININDEVTGSACVELSPNSITTLLYW